MRCVYYSLVLTKKQAGYERQWIRSVRSLRQYNAEIPVNLFVFNTPSNSLLDAAARYQVNVRPLGDYRDHMSEEFAALSCIPTLHKLLPLEFIGSDVSQVLYLGFSSPTLNRCFTNIGIAIGTLGKNLFPEEVSFFRTTRITWMRMPSGH
jgi:hypothetical protein